MYIISKLYYTILYYTLYYILYTVPYTIYYILCTIALQAAASRRPPMGAPGLGPVYQMIIPNYQWRPAAEVPQVLERLAEH